ncbi:MAG: family 16 glycoside hydrolase [Candidatus Kariarchaeaceae archaeon]|jgi:hypothetical protein
MIVLSFFDLTSSPIITNSDQWETLVDKEEPIIQITNNVEEDHIGGKVALLGAKLKNYKMEAEFKFLGHHLSLEQAGWFGFVIRAKDLKNYELLWFMPQLEGDIKIAYLPVAHGIVPWWTEAYNTQEKVSVKIAHDSWFHARVEAIGNEITVYIDDMKLITKKLTYYLEEGYPGLYVGTSTDAAFRKIRLVNIE